MLQVSLLIPAVNSYPSHNLTTAYYGVTKPHDKEMHLVKKLISPNINCKLEVYSV